MGRVTDAPTESLAPELAPDVVADVAEPELPAQPTEAVAHPAKVMRIGAMIRQLLEEVRRAPLDEAGREVLSKIYRTSLQELTEGLSEDLQEELLKLAAP